ncbi:MAG TPA: SUMF1/EgtB/PvdO family nonheme iron enzyme, partial [Kofleriaceae bacterium]|nr:SUMF1/EgtB/PvdO family nonheme iron enzyme [Kofleriaceae bacterium]
AQLDLALPARVQQFLAAGEERHRALRRRRRIRYGVAAAALSGAAIFAFIWIGRYLERERLIRVNAGTLDLVLEPYDRIGGRMVPVTISDLPSFWLALHATAPGDPHTPGRAIPDHLVEILRVSTAGSRRTVRIRAPGGMAFLAIHGRGRRGETCAPSWIRIQAFPGYTEMAEPKTYEVQVPTCQATRDDTIPIEAGPFVYGGPGQPPSQLYGVDPDYTEDRHIITLPEYRIDQMEISNAMFEPFARLEKLTGYPAPIYSNEPIHLHDGDPEYPVTEIDAFEAEAFCRYMGKQLPSDHQWTKAARGGLMSHGQKNPLPERLFPWGATPSPRCANLEGLEDGYRWVAPVTEFKCGASPDGVLNLGGNVLEWISREGQTDKDKMLHYALRGGAADSPPQLEHASTIFRNHSDPRAVSYSVGARCVEVTSP